MIYFTGSPCQWGRNWGSNPRVRRPFHRKIAPPCQIYTPRADTVEIFWHIQLCDKECVKYWATIKLVRGIKAVNGWMINYPTTLCVEKMLDSFLWMCNVYVTKREIILALVKFFVDKAFGILPSLFACKAPLSSWGDAN